MTRYAITSLLMIVGLIGAPRALHAALLINEIAWMGTEQSANDEWIELYNSGESIDVTDWQLTDGKDLTIELSGTIPAQSYAVLERTDDSTAPGTAFLIYTGALVNTGATLTLRRADGSVADQVAGGSDWAQIGGDNTTKETAQLTRSGWTTGAPTPGAANVSYEPPAREKTTTDDDTTDEGATTTSEDATDNGASEITQLSLPDTELALMVAGPDRAYVNQPVTFTAEPSGIAESWFASLQYEWNFGDLSTGSGRDVTHEFSHPGEYVVTVRGHVARHEQVARRTVTVLPSNLSITRSDSGDVQLHNDARYEIDLSGYVVTGRESLTIPPRTVLLPQGTITIAKERLDLQPGQTVAVHDQANQLAALWHNTPRQSSAEPTDSTPSAMAQRDVAPVAQPTNSHSSSSQFTFASADSDVVPATTTSTTDSTTATHAPRTSTTTTLVAGAAAAAPATLAYQQYAYVGLFGILLLLIVAVLLSRRTTPHAATEVEQTPTKKTDRPTDTPVFFSADERRE